MPATVKFDYERTRVVCQLAHDAWVYRTQPEYEDLALAFRSFTPPEQRMCPEFIKVGSLKHAQWLFFVAWLNRSGKTAEEVFRMGNEIARDHFWMINPAVERVTKKFRAAIGKAVPFGELEPKRVDWWIQCKELLRTRYNSDPRNIFMDLPIGESHEDIMLARAELIRRFEEFMGIGHKIAQLTVIWFTNVEWPKNRRYWRFLQRIPMIPADLWILRMVRQLGLVEEYSTDHRDEVSRIVADELSYQCLVHGWSAHDLAQALWHAGAKVCAYVPRNIEKRGKYCFHRCPVHQHCAGPVRADPEQKNRGSMGWDNPPTVSRTLFTMLNGTAL